MYGTIAGANPGSVGSWAVKWDRLLPAPPQIGPAGKSKAGQLDPKQNDRLAGPRYFAGSALRQEHKTAGLRNSADDPLPRVLLASDSDQHIPTVTTSRRGKELRQNAGTDCDEDDVELDSDEEDDAWDPALDSAAESTEDEDDGDSDAPVFVSSEKADGWGDAETLPPIDGVVWTFIGTEPDALADAALPVLYQMQKRDDDDDDDVDEEAAAAPAVPISTDSSVYSDEYNFDSVSS
eukprot:COSAG05_NODE_257_length_12748_cov_68.067120_2_plen_236_part_00